MDALRAGWYGLEQDGDGWKPATPCENRHSIALADAYDAGATHVGYWTGSAWESVEAVD